ncbi:MAG: UbiA family prenyltransferase [Bacteroidales bacterium]|nr:UbiA family prenyltransferase [Bacteroidales bacterium]
MVNHPETVIVSRSISRRLAMTLHFVLTGMGLLAGIYVSYRTGLLVYSLIFMGTSGLLWFYSTTYKSQLITGNVIVSALTAMVPLIVLIYEMPLLSRHYGSITDGMGLDAGQMTRWVLFFSLLAFMFTMVREVVKDVEDMEGDEAFGMNTLPIVLGVKNTKRIIHLLNLMAITTTVFFYFRQPFHVITFSYLLVFIIFPAIFCSFLISRAETKTHYKQVSILLKIILLMGVLYALLARFVILTSIF